MVKPIGRKKKLPSTRLLNINTKDLKELEKYNDAAKLKGQP